MSRVSVADSGERGAGAGGLVGNSAVVVAELEEDDVAGLDEGERVGPMTLGDVGARGAAADGAVDDVDSAGSKKAARGSPQPH